jgi:alkylhydroperoxidase/carboxymuconolactone decarboxylase family protein YurZ
MMRRAWWGTLAIAGTLFVQGCETPKPTQDLLAPTEAQMKMRSFQTRTFDLEDRHLAMRAVIAALQDLGFII